MKNRMVFLVVSIVFLTLVLNCCVQDRRVESDESQITLHARGIESLFIPLDYAPALNLVFSTLFKYDENHEPQGDLVEAWDHSSDYRTWTYRIRKNVVWHDGIPLTAHDVKFSLELYSHPEIAMFLSKAYSVQMVDDHTLTITYHDRTLEPQHDNLFILPMHLLKELDPKEFPQWKIWQDPVGSGPYQIVRQVPKTMWELEVNRNFYRKRPKIERVIFKFANNPTVELLSGNVDSANYYGDDMVTFEKNPDFRIYQQQINANGNLYWNINSDLFKDKRVRKALTMAINRRELCRLRGVPDDVPLIDGPLSMKEILTGNVMQAIPYDPVEADRILGEVGWIDTNGDGIRDRGGKKFKFTAITIQRSYKNAVYVQAELKKIGVQMDIQTFSSGNVLRKRWSSSEYDANFFYSNWYWNQERLNPNSIIHNWYVNPELNEIIKIADNDWTSGWEERRNAKIWKIFQEDVPWTYLHPLMTKVVAHRRVKGLMSPSRVFPEYAMEHLWIEEEK